MRFRLLGAVEVEGAGDAALLRRAKVRALLALLLLNANRPVAVERLISGLWGDDPPDTAVGALQNYVSQLRKTLGAETVLTRSPGYLIVVGEDELDLDVFRRVTHEAAAAEPEERVRLLREALALWRGFALADLRGEPIYEAEAGALDNLRFAARERLYAAELELGAGAGVVAELEAWAREDPTREPPWALLMVALYRSGRQADALDAFQRARASLDDLGLEPGERLQELQRAILRHDPSLAPPPTARREEIGAPTGGARRTVTVVFVDVTASTELAAALDAETLREVMESFFGEMRGAVERHGGVVEKFAGDEVLAVFGTPTAHEDDAVRAVRAAAEMQLGVRGLDAGLAAVHGVRFDARVGINTGEVVAGRASAGGTFVTGTAVNVGKRVQQAAAPGETLLTASTLALVRDAVVVDPVGALDVRGVEGPVEVFRLLEVDPAAAGVERSFATPLVGRVDELAVLRSAFELARAEARCIRVTVVGHPGIGKTRLARELVATLEDEARILVGRCVAYGDGATYLPVRDALRDELETASDDAVARLRDVLDSKAGPSVAADVMLAARAALTSLARDRPVVLVFDDVHWGEQTFLDLIEYLAGWIREAPVLVLAIARPEVLDARPEWSNPDSGAILRLAPLGDVHIRALIDAVADDATTPDERDRIAAIAEGYPFFAEQLVAWSTETGGLDVGEVPPTVEALLASRLDRLDPAERAVLERAAVVGREFWTGAVAALTPPSELGALNRHLLGLMRKGFVRPAVSNLPGEDALRFHHVLIRDVAYEAIPKAARAELHERCADWLDEHAADVDEIVGYHLEQAYRCRQELGPARIASRLAADAGERLGRAGVRALARGDGPAAVSLLRRASDVLPPASIRRVELLCELGVSEYLVGEGGAASATLESALAEAVDASDVRLQHRARLELASIRIFLNQMTPDDATAVALAAQKVFAAVGDDRALGRSYLLWGLVRGSFAGDNMSWDEGMQRGLEHYRRAGWPTATCLQSCAALLFGPHPAASAIARCNELLETAVTDAVGEAHVLRVRGPLHALQGAFDDAYADVARARRTYEELRQPINVGACDSTSAFIASLAGDFAAAEQILRRLTRELDARGELAQLANRAAELADVLWAGGRAAEALEWAHTSKAHAEASDVVAQFSWRSVLAKALAANGDVDAACELSGAALEIVDSTDCLNQRAGVRLDRAHVLVHAGRVGDAAGVAREAVELYEEKGNVIGAQRAARIAPSAD